ncbi:Pyridine nucleotide-disulfide oxidoreductase, partial [Globisporangium splendens]
MRFFTLETWGINGSRAERKSGIVQFAALDERRSKRSAATAVLNGTALGVHVRPLVCYAKKRKRDGSVESSHADPEHQTKWENEATFNRSRSWLHSATQENQELMVRIVIIGAGPAGINCAQTLAKQLTPADAVEVVVLEKSKFFYHAVGTPRAYTDASFSPKLFIPYDHAIPASAASFVKIVRAVATGVTVAPNTVSYQRINDDDQEEGDAQSIEYDYLIIATGSTYTVPIKQDPHSLKRADTELKLQEVREHIARADSILIVGGGAVGCEVAGDIAAKYPDKSVTILEARDKLIASNDLRNKFYSYLNHSLAKLKIKVILGERLEERLTGNVFEKRTLTTDKGTKIESDIQLLCGGFHPVADLIERLDASLVTDRGLIKVNDQLQLEGSAYQHIYALGDATNHATPKLAYWAGQQGTFLATELLAVVRGNQSMVTKPFPKVEVEALLLPLGPCGGVSQLPVWGGMVVGDTMTWLVKSRDFFAGKTWASLGAKMPN